MESSIKKKMIMWAITMFLERLSTEDVKRWIDYGLDILEDKVKQSATDTDDLIVLPLVKVVREAIQIPDDE